MGCCLSSSKPSTSPATFPATFPATSPAKNGSRDPPLMEEETVKEVLSETPAPKPTRPDIHEPQNRIENVVEEEKKEIEKNIQVSEVSEISSEILSISTYTDKIEDGEEVHQRIIRSSAVKLRNNRSFSGDLGLKREMLQNRALNRRSDQSPGRRIGAPGSMVRRGVRAEAGEKSGRRFGSPGTSRSGIGRSSSVRKSGSSPGRVGMDPNESPRKVAEDRSVVVGKMSSQSESLENPLVSLECFIFL